MRAFIVIDFPCCAQPIFCASLFQIYFPFKISKIRAFTDVN